MKTRFTMLVVLALILLVAVSVAVGKQPPQGYTNSCGLVSVELPDGTPVPAVGINMYLTVSGQFGWMVAHTLTDNGGYYSMGAPEGTYTISQAPPTQWLYMGTIYNLTPDPSSYEDVHVKHTTTRNFNILATPAQ